MAIKTPTRVEGKVWLVDSNGRLHEATLNSNGDVFMNHHGPTITLVGYLAEVVFAGELSRHATITDGDTLSIKELVVRT